MSWRVEHGSCLELLRGLEDASVDAVVTDPPYGLGKEPKPVELLEAWLRGDDYKPGSSGFMGRKWDAFVPGPHYWREVIRVLKPGGHAVVFAGTRTTDLMTLSLRLAGFEIRDELQWIYGSGMPKSHNVRKATGNAEVATSGTALKPAHEPVILVRKPLAGTIGKTVNEYGTGALNIDGCRVAHASADDLAAHESGVNAIKARGGSMDNSWKNSSDLSGASDVSTDGRWPPNLLLSHSPGCVCTGTEEVKANPTWDTPNRDTEPSSFTGSEISKVRHAAEDVLVWECVEGCPVAELNSQAGPKKKNGSISDATGVSARSNSIYGVHNAPRGAFTAYQDSGTASRYFPQLEWTELDDVSPFFYCPKASRSERDAGLTLCPPLGGGELTNRDSGSAGLKNGRAGAGRTSNGCDEEEFEIWANGVRLVVLRVVMGTSHPRVIGVSTTPASVDNEWSTFLFGNDTTESFLKVCKCTIETKTSSTTESRILNFLALLGTSENTADAISKMASNTSPVANADVPGPCLTITLGRTASLPGVGTVASGTLLKISVGEQKKHGRRSSHPTVKPIALMRWLCRLITPPGGLIIDPFCGSGTTGAAAVLEGFSFIGYELNDTDTEPFVRLARARIAYAESNPQPVKKTPRKQPKHTGQVSLF